MIVTIPLSEIYIVKVDASIKVGLGQVLITNVDITHVFFECYCMYLGNPHVKHFTDYVHSNKCTLAFSFILQRVGERQTKRETQGVKGKEKEERERERERERLRLRLGVHIYRCVFVRERKKERGVRRQRRERKLDMYSVLERGRKVCVCCLRVYVCLCCQCVCVCVCEKPKPKCHW